jgi:hypothetical protein
VGRHRGLSVSTAGGAAPPRSWRPSATWVSVGSCCGHFVRASTRRTLRAAMVAGVLASLGELELELGKERRTAARDARRARGQSIGRPKALTDENAALHVGCTTAASRPRRLLRPWAWPSYRLPRAQRGHRIDTQSPASVASLPKNARPGVSHRVDNRIGFAAAMRLHREDGPRSTPSAQRRAKPSDG